MDITITGAMAGSAILAACIWFVKEKVTESQVRRVAFESHIRICTEKAIAFALIEQKVRDIAQQIEADRKIRHWIGDCIQIMGTKMDAHLPERPR